MSGLPILDLVLGLIFIYFLLSIICSSAVEIVQSAGGFRAKQLEKWIRQIFNKPALNADGKFYDTNGNTYSEDQFGNLVDVNGKISKRDNLVTLGGAILDHSATTALSKAGKTGTYIDATNFVTALLDKISIKKSGHESPLSTQLDVPASIEDYINKLKTTVSLTPDLQRTLIGFANAAKSSATPDISQLEAFGKKIEDWYDTSNQRLTGTFKRKVATPLTILFALILTLAGNIDSVAISKYLYTNKEVSKQIADKAVAVIPSFKDTASKPLSDTAAANNIKRGVESLNSVISAGFPIGWGKDFSFKMFTSSFSDHILGWLATIFAIMMGAPFWFDMFNKIANLRGSGAKPTTAETEQKKTS